VHVVSTAKQCIHERKNGDPEKRRVKQISRPKFAGHILLPMHISKPDLQAVAALAHKKKMDEGRPKEQRRKKELEDAMQQSLGSIFGMSQAEIKASVAMHGLVRTEG
jgi:hypothetical protein